MTTDLTKGNPIRLLIFFSLPLLAGNIFQQFYSMADAIIVGRFVGAKALAAVGCTGSINFFILGAAVGIAGGFCIIVSQRFGAKDEDGLRRAVAISVELSAISSVSIMLLSVIFAVPLLQVMQTPEDIFHDAYMYIVIIFWGIPGTVFYNLFSGILRSVGDSRTPLFFLALASVGNIVLDFVFVLFFQMGPAGAAVATIVSQTLSGIACLIFIFKKFAFLIPKKSDWKFDPALAASLMRLGLPSALSNSVCAIGTMAMQGVVNSFGSDIVAGYTAGTKIESLAVQPCFAFSTALSTFVAQNVGARKMERVRKGTHDCLKLMVGCAALGWVVAHFFGASLVGVFLENPTEEVVAASALYLNWIGAFIFALGVLLTYRCSISGMGNANIPMLSGAVELAMRVPVAFLTSGFLGFVSVCLCGPAAWVGAAIMLGIAYYRIEQSTAARLSVHA